MKKKLKLRRWVKIGILIIVILIFINIIKLLNKEDEKFMKGCMSVGFSYEYCLAHK